MSDVVASSLPLCGGGGRRRGRGAQQVFSVLADSVWFRSRSSPAAQLPKPSYKMEKQF